MTNRTALFALIALTAMSRSPAYGVQPAELIAGITSRSQAIVSGRLTYSFAAETSHGPRAPGVKTYPTVALSFSDSSWAERTKGSHVVRINHDGYFLEFVQTPQRDGSVRPGATLFPQRSLESRSELNAPPLYAGCFWFREQLRYVENHADKFHLASSAVVNTIPVSVLELTVPKEDSREAFHVVLPNLKSGGTIRLYVAPQLGFVLPRIEFLTASSEVAVSYDAVDFNEVAAGIYFPRSLWMEMHEAGGSAGFRGEFTTQCEMINQPLPPQDFVVELPVGTRVQDAQRPDNVTSFVLKENLSSTELAADAKGSMSFLGFLERWRNAVIVGVVIGTTASIGFLIAGRRQRSRGQFSKSPSHVYWQA